MLIGGAADDAIDGGTHDDLIFGDHVQLIRRDVGRSSTERHHEPALPDPERHASSTGHRLPTDATEQRTSTALAELPRLRRHIRARLGRVPDRNLYRLVAIEAANDNNFGNDYIAGGAGDDMIFGELGNDDDPGRRLDRLRRGRLRRRRRHPGTPQRLRLALVSVRRRRGDRRRRLHRGRRRQRRHLRQPRPGRHHRRQLEPVRPRRRRPRSGPDGADLIFGGSGTDDRAATTRATRARTATRTTPTRSSATTATSSASSGARRRDAASSSFNYDTTADSRSSPRAIALLDYTPGGPRLQRRRARRLTSAAADEIHGESGDDFIYGRSATTSLFGDGQNDTIIGGYGNDWISGGTGDDGILGDDGRIFAQPRSAHARAARTASPVDRAARTPRSRRRATQQDVIQPRRRAAVHRRPDARQPRRRAQRREPEHAVRAARIANDIIYGGLGNDSIHGGAGDDAISGAEALDGLVHEQLRRADGATSCNAAPIESDYFHPFNPGNVLGYSADADRTRRSTTRTTRSR